MNEAEERRWLIDYLIREDPQYQNIEIPVSLVGQQRLLRSLMNVRMPSPASEEFLKIQNDYLQKRAKEKGVVDYHNLKPMQDGIYLYQGDITTLKCDAIVNAANSQMLGCFQPCHGCIDNVIHTYAGVQLRWECYEIMRKKGHEEETGKAEITKGYNLPASHVLHTVGPIVSGHLNKENKEQLVSCYRSCMNLAEENHLHSIAFCCISTGVFMFPQDKAAEIAANTVKKWKKNHEGSCMQDVIFNVFKDSDRQIYEELLSDHGTLQEHSRNPFNS